MFTKKLAKQITSLVLCTMLVLLMVVPGFAAENEGSNVATLKSIRFVDLIETLTKVDSSGVPLAENAEGFSSDHFNYSAKFPYVKDTNSFYVPDIEAVPTDDNATYEVTNSDITKGAITIVVTAENGVATQTYTIIGETVGENLYVDGDFETLFTQTGNQALVDSAGNVVWAPDKNYGTSFSVIRTEYATGVKAMKVSGSVWNVAWSGKFKGDNSGLKAGKKYYAAMQAKIEKNSNKESFETRHTIRKDFTGEKTVYDADGNVNGKPYVYRDRWTELGLVLAPTADCNPVYHVVSRTDGSDPEYVVDDYYIGELVVSKIEVTNEDGTSFESIASADLTVPKTIALSAKTLNQYGTVAGLETLTVKQWRTAESYAGVTVDEDGVVTVAQDTVGGKYYIEALVDTSAPTSAGQGTVKGVFTVTVSDGTLETLTVSAPHVVDFETGTLNYTLDVPAVHINGQDTYTMPVVSAKARDNEHTVDVDYPDAVTDGSQILVFVKDADENIVDTYTLTLNTIGDNMYVDGDFESVVNGSDNRSLVDSKGTKLWTLDKNVGTTLSEYRREYATGAKSMRISGMAWNVYCSGMLKNGNTGLKANKKYYGSLQTKIPSDFNKTSFTTRVNMRNSDGTSFTGTKIVYDAQGNVRDGSNNTANAHPTVYNDSWSDYGMVMIPNTDCNPVYFIVSTIGSGQPDYLVDDYYLSELVVSKVEITSEDIDVTQNISSPKEIMTVNLTSKLLNQEQICAGLENIDTTLSLVNAPQGVTLEEGVLTIPAGFVGEIKVRSDADLSSAGLTQKAVYGEISIVVGETGITGTADEAKLVYVNNTGKSVPVLFYVALYEKTENGTLKFVSGTPKTGTCTADTAIYSDTQPIIVPNDGKTYVVKAFGWKNDGTYSPLMKSETLR